MGTKVSGGYWDRYAVIDAARERGILLDLLRNRSWLVDFFLPARVLYKPKLKFDHRRVEAILMDIGAASRLVHPTRALAEAKHEPDNRFLECAEAAQADFLITGNKKHFPKDWGPVKIVNAREFIDQRS